MSKLENYVEGEIDYILANKKNLTKDLLKCIFDTHKTMVRLDYLIEKNLQIARDYEAETAHGHGGNDNIPQPDQDAGIMSPIIRNNGGTGDGC